MLNSTISRAKGAKVRIIGLVAILVIALTTFLILELGYGYEKLNHSPVLMLFTIIFLGSGLFYIAYAVIFKRTLMTALGGFSTVIGIVFLLAFLKIIWWVILLIAVVLLIATFGAVVAMKAPNLVVEVNNASDAGHKTYAERKAEEAQKPKEEEKPLPEIKSFKD